MKNKINYGQIAYNWLVPEYMTHERSRNWYIAASVAGLALMVYSFITSNFLFAVIIIIAALIIIIHDGQKPARVNVAITDHGVVVGKKFSEYSEFKNFALVVREEEKIKNLYFEYKSAISQRLAIPLENQDQQKIKETLLKYLPEDKTRTDIPLSEQLTRLLKL